MDHFKQEKTSGLYQGVLSVFSLYHYVYQDFILNVTSIYNSKAF